MRIFIYCKVTLHVSGVQAPIIRSTKNCNRSLRYRWPDRPRWREVAVPVLWPVPEAAVTVFSTPDDGCCDTRNMYSDFAVNKYLHTVASGWNFINIDIKRNLLQCFSKLWNSRLHTCHFLCMFSLEGIIEEMTGMSASYSSRLLSIV